MANYTAIDKSTDHFETILWSSVDTSITGLDFRPDWVWIKSRTNADTQVLFDSVRGVTKRLSSSATTIEQTKTDELTAFNSDGFTIGTGSNVNRSGHNYVAWCWRGGTAFSNDASSTGVGSIDSSGSVNDTAGISICKWVGTGSNGTVKHGLTTKPQVILQKNTSYAYDWYTWHHGIAINNYLKLNTTGGATSSDSGGVTFGNTDPTTSVFSLGNDGGSNRSGDTHIAYIFSERRGFSKFGTYVGNGAGSGGGPYINLGFRPAFFLLKESDGSDNWTLMDNKRLGYNARNDHLFPNLNNAEYATDRIDMLGNGIKIIDNDGSINQSGQTYVYYAFAENPLVTSSGVAGLAR